MGETQQFNHDDRVTEKWNGAGTVIHLHGDLIEDGSGKRYNWWPGWVCVRFDKPINGKVLEEWYDPEELSRIEDCICEQYAGVRGSAEWVCPQHGRCSTGSFIGVLRETKNEE